MSGDAVSCCHSFGGELSSSRVMTRGETGVRRESRRRSPKLSRDCSAKFKFEIVFTISQRSFHKGLTFIVNLIIGWLREF